jgi:hypothetical protein
VAVDASGVPRVADFTNPVDVERQQAVGANAHRSDAVVIDGHIVRGDAGNVDAPGSVQRDRFAPGAACCSNRAGTRVGTPETTTLVRPAPALISVLKTPCSRIRSKPETVRVSEVSAAAAGALSGVTSSAPSAQTNRKK